MRSEPPKHPVPNLFIIKTGLYNVRNLPETPIIFLVYSPKSYKMCLAYQKRFWAILIAIREINYIKHCTDRNYVHKHAYRGSD
jgi:hypothetical protein